MSGRAVVAILGTRYEDFSLEAEVLAACDIEIRSGPGADREQILSAAASADVILAGSAPRFDAETIEGLACRGIVRYGVGTESIDLAAARRHGMWVVRVADYGTESVATHAVTLALAGIRRLREADQRVRDGRWEFATLRPLRLPSASTVGLVGFGRIGQHAARQFAGIGFRVVAYDPAVPVDGLVPGVTSASLEELLAVSDVISLHLPGAPDGTPLLDAAAMGRLKEGSVLVNTARGSLVDLEALRRGLLAGRPRVAALDVLPTEPPDPALLDGLEDRLLLTPHMAWYTEESERDLRVKAAHETLRLLKGERPHDVVVEPADTMTEGA